MNLRSTIYDMRFVRRFRSRSILVVFALLVISPDKIRAADPVAEFSTANKLYAAGKFAEAAGLYEKVADSASSSSVWFNDGNARFKAGNPGQAIAAYRRAELLAPRDAEIRANLAFVRRQVQGETGGQNFWQNWLGQLTVNEWTWLAMVAFWSMFGLLVARQIKPKMASKLRGPLWTAFVLAVVFGAAAGLQAREHLFGKTAVVIAKDSTARSGPFDDAQTMFTVRDGVEFSVQDTHNGWVRVVDSSGRTGWLSGNDVAVVPDA